MMENKIIDLEAVKLIIEGFGLNTGSRKRELCYQRFCIYEWLRAKHQIDKKLTFEFIGLLFGERDHATVVSGIRKIKEVEIYEDYIERTEAIRIALNTIGVVEIKYKEYKFTELETEILNVSTIAELKELQKSLLNKQKIEV